MIKVPNKELLGPLSWQPLGAKRCFFVQVWKLTIIVTAGVASGFSRCSPQEMSPSAHALAVANRWRRSRPTSNASAKEEKWSSQKRCLAKEGGHKEASPVLVRLKSCTGDGVGADKALLHGSLKRIVCRGCCCFYPATLLDDNLGIH